MGPGLGQSPAGEQGVTMKDNSVVFVTGEIPHRQYQGFKYHDWQREDATYRQEQELVWRVGKTQN